MKKPKKPLTPLQIRRKLQAIWKQKGVRFATHKSRWQIDDENKICARQGLFVR